MTLFSKIQIMHFEAKAFYRIQGVRLKNFIVQKFLQALDG